MNDRAQVGLIILIAIVSVIVFGIINYGDEIYNLIPINADSNNLASNKIIDSYCEENIIPKSFVTYKGHISGGINEDLHINSGMLEFISPEWKDGTKLGISPDGLEYINKYNCRMGEFEGENINYLYCGNIGYSKEIKEIDDDGNVISIDNRNYRINISIDLADIMDTKIYSFSSKLSFGRSKSIQLNINPVIDYSCERSDF